MLWSESENSVMDNFLSREEIANIGLKQYGEDILIGRHAVFYHPERLEIGSHVRIDDFTIVSGRVRLGDYIHISQFCGLYGGHEGIVIEDFSTLAAKCSVYAVSDDYTGMSMTTPFVSEKYKPYAIEKPVHIMKRVIIGCGSVVLPGVILQEGTAVGSMSLCNKTTVAWSVYAGIPARKIRDREKEMLQLEKMFLEEQNGHGRYSYGYE